MSRILVTGGAGYIGSICAAELIRQGHRVTILDDLSMGFRDAAPAEAEFEPLRVEDHEAIAALCRTRNFEGVYHFAGKALIPESIINPGIFFDCNLAAGIRFLETLRHQGVRRFIFSSTAAVYGDPQTVPMPETHPVSPLNAYGESKLAFERVLEWYARAYGWNVSILRYFSAAGATAERGERHQPETHVIPLLLDAAAGEIPAFTIYGRDYPTPDGFCWRDFIHVRDLALAHAMVWARDQPGCEIYNLGSGRMYSLQQLCTTVQAVSGRDFSVHIGPRRPGDPAQLCADPAKFMRTFPWRPSHSDLETIIRDAWLWKLSAAKLMPVGVAA